MNIKRKLYTILVVSLSLSLTLSGCAIHGHQKKPEVAKCKYIERDLSSSWEERVYWCIPNSISGKNTLEKGGVIR